MSYDYSLALVLAAVAFCGYGLVRIVWDRWPRLERRWWVRPRALEMPPPAAGQPTLAPQLRAMRPPGVRLARGTSPQYVTPTRCPLCRQPLGQACRCHQPRGAA